MPALFSCSAWRKPTRLTHARAPCSTPLLTLDRYCGDWCEGLTLVRDRGEKEAAFKGLCLVVRHNPAGVLNVSQSIASRQAIASLAKERSRKK